MLTFMYEEDRQAALAMYSRMFDEAEDEQALLTLLVSPTRQAVVVARAYDAKERKLQVHAQSRDEDGVEAQSQETPDFVLAINQIWESVPVRQAQEPPVPADQFSLFEDGLPTPEAEPGQAPAASEDEVSAVPAEEEKEAPEDASGLEEQPAEASDEAEAEPEEAGKAEPAPEDEVDSFLADFSIEGSELEPEKTQDAQPVSEMEDASDAQKEQDAQNTEEGIALVVEEELYAEEESAFEAEFIRKPKVFLLILYVILAVPVTLAGVVLLLVPTLLSLVLAIGVVGLGSVTLVAAFSGFAVFADILVILGAALVVLALGLLFLWLFVWFIGGAIVGLIRGVLELGRRWCYKEVPAV